MRSPGPRFCRVCFFVSGKNPFELFDLITQQSGLFELQIIRRLEHFRFQFAESLGHIELRAGIMQ